MTVRIVLLWPIGRSLQATDRPTARTKQVRSSRGTLRHGGGPSGSSLQLEVDRASVHNDAERHRHAAFVEPNIFFFVSLNVVMAHWDRGPLDGDGAGFTTSDVDSGHS